MTKPLTTAKGAREAAEALRNQAERISRVDRWMWSTVMDAVHALTGVSAFYTDHPEMEVHE